MTRPREITWFMLLQLVSIAAGLWQMLTQWDAMVAQAGGNLGDTGVKITVAVTYAITLLLLYFIWNRSNVARWIYIAFAALGVAMAVPALSGADPVTLFQTAISIASIVLLFLTPVRNWFAGKAGPDAFS